MRRNKGETPQISGFYTGQAQQGGSKAWAIQRLTQLTYLCHTLERRAESPASVFPKCMTEDRILCLSLFGLKGGKSRGNLSNSKRQFWGVEERTCKSSIPMEEFASPLLPWCWQTSHTRKTWPSGDSSPWDNTLGAQPSPADGTVWAGPTQLWASVRTPHAPCPFPRVSGDPSFGWVGGEPHSPSCKWADTRQNPGPGC